MNNSYLINSNSGLILYDTVCNLPIYDYHCHLSPKEIYEDTPFNNVSEMMLAHDHYKWRLMRSFGIAEEYITGKADFLSKFKKYAEAFSLAAGNPLYYWTKMELSKYFGIEEPLNLNNAEKIYINANNIIKEKSLSPRKLINNSNVKYIATTDDICDNLEYHILLKNEGYSVEVTPSFRTDKLLLINNKNYCEYIVNLSDVSGIQINDLVTLKAAIIKRLDFFKENGCKFTDVGIPYFPSHISNEQEADAAFKEALSGKSVTDYDGFLGNMYLFLAIEYRKRNLVMQMHLAVWRNANTPLFEQCGADCGADCMGEDIPVSNLINIFDSIEKSGGLPKTVLYSLKPNLYPVLCNMAANYRNCICGAAWWFCDNMRGIKDQLYTMAEQGHLATFLGMLTDSRSFLSYARHDYFRRILCNVIGGFVDCGEFDFEAAKKLAKLICLENIKTLTEEKR